MIADGHGECRNGQHRRDQPDADRIQQTRLSLPRRVEIVRRGEIAHRRHHHQRVALHKSEPPRQEEVALRQRRQHAPHVGRRHQLQPQAHRHPRIGIAVLLDQRGEHAEHIGRADAEPGLDDLVEIGGHDVVDRVTRGGKVPAGLPHRLAWAGCVEPPGFCATNATRIGRGTGGPSSGTSAHRVSSGSPCAIAANASRASRTLRVSGPCTAISCAPIRRATGWLGL
jgi:hypothetical protein